MDLAAAAAAVAVLAGAGAQAVTGIGFSLVCAPLLTLALGGGDGVRIANVLAIGVNLLILRGERRAADARSAVALLAPAAVTAVLVSWAIRGASPQALSVASGALVLVAVAALASGRRIRALSGGVGAVLAGAVSGAMNVVGGVGGPAAASYALNARWSPATMRATLALYFLGINVVSVVSRGVPGAAAWFYPAVIAALVAGFGAGTLAARRLDAAVVRSGTLVLAALGGAAAIAQGWR